MMKNLKYVLFFLCALIVLVAVQISAQTVTMTVPTQNALDVGENSMIYVAFDRNVDAATVTSSTFKVIGSTHGEYSGTITPSGQYILFSSAESFAFGEKITVISTSSIGFSDGTILTNGYTFSFIINTCGDGYKATSEFTSTPDDVYKMVKGDFNSDGKMDLITTSSYPNSDRLTVFLNEAGSLVQLSHPLFSGYYFDDMSVADFNGDGKIDLVAQSDTWGNIAVLANDGAGNFSLLTETGSYVMKASYPADMDSDGDIDLVIVKQEYDEYFEEIDQNLVILYNDGNGSFGNPLFIDNYLAYSEFATLIEVVDFNNDGLLDITVNVNGQDPNIRIYLNNGSGTYTESASYRTNRTDEMLVADFNSDGLVDIASFYQSTYYSTVEILDNNGNGTFSPQTAMYLSQYTYSFTSGDFDSDGDIDLASVAHYPASNWGIQIMDNNSGTFTDGLRIADYFRGNQLLTFDIDSDKSLDYLSTTSTDNHFRTLSVRKGLGAAEKPVLYSPVNGKELNAPATPHLNCNDVDNATAYYFEIDDDINFGSPIRSPLLTPVTVSEWYVPEELGVGTYYWRVRAANATCGVGIWSDVWHIVVVSPPPPPPPKDDYQIANYPNPFNPTTTISYSLAANNHVKIEVINLLGQTIKTLVDQSQVAGEHSVLWDGKNEQGTEVSSGVYFYRIQSDDFNATKKMMYLK